MFVSPASHSDPSKDALVDTQIANIMTRLPVPAKPEMLYVPRHE